MLGLFDYDFSYIYAVVDKISTDTERRAVTLRQINLLLLVPWPLLSSQVIWDRIQNAVFRRSECCLVWAMYFVTSHSSLPPAHWFRTVIFPALCLSPPSHFVENISSTRSVRQTHPPRMHFTFSLCLTTLLSNRSPVVFVLWPPPRSSPTVYISKSSVAIFHAIFYVAEFITSATEHLLLNVLQLPSIWFRFSFLNVHFLLIFR